MLEEPVYTVKEKEERSGENGKWVQKLRDVWKRPTMQSCSISLPQCCDPIPLFSLSYCPLFRLCITCSARMIAIVFVRY